MALFIALAIPIVPAVAVAAAATATEEPVTQAVSGSKAYDSPGPGEFDDYADTCPAPDEVPTEEELEALVARGRDLFTSPDAFGQQASQGPTVAGEALSCADCHTGDARTDGRTHIVGPTEHRPSVPRQTPHLLRIGDAAPYGWDGRFPCLQAAIKNAIVSPLEMNAADEPAQYGLDALAAFVATLDVPDAVPGVDYDPELAAWGERLFAQYRGVDIGGDFNPFDGVACVHCHVDPDGTDREFHPILLPPPLLPVGGLDPGHIDDQGRVRGFKTPVLRGTRFTAPYFHDGSMGIPGQGESLGREATIAALLEMMAAYRARFFFDFTPEEELAIVHYLLSQ
ncbi:MAG: hypothetical protein GEU97_14925 [Actinophytocola sp.]|nr:hypothetical protein [Actinophytocola sp.]